VLARADGVNVDVALEALRAYARSTRRRPVDLARDVVTGTVDLSLP
jgi:hypothetical protein